MVSYFLIRTIIVCIALAIGHLLFAEALTTSSWGVIALDGYKYTFGLAKHCFHDECFNIKLSGPLIYALFGLYFLTNAFILSIYRVLYNSKMNDKLSKASLQDSIVHCIISAFFSGLSWIMFYKTNNDSQQIIGGSLMFGWSFYLQIASFSMTILTMVSLVVCALSSSNSRFILSTSNLAFCLPAFVLNVTGLFTNYLIVNKNNEQFSLGYFGVCSENVCKRQFLNEIITFEILGFAIGLGSIILGTRFGSYQLKAKQFWTGILIVNLISIAFSTAGHIRFAQNKSSNDEFMLSDGYYTNYNFGWSFYMAISSTGVYVIASIMSAIQLIFIKDAKTNKVYTTKY